MGENGKDKEKCPEEDKRGCTGTEKRWKCPKTLDFWEAWLQIGCKKVLSICYQNDLNICNVNAAER